jgi:hypothetical protein
MLDASLGVLARRVYTYIAGVTVDDGLALDGTVLAVSSVAGHCDRYGGLGWVLKGCCDGCVVEL